MHVTDDTVTTDQQEPEIESNAPAEQADGASAPVLASWADQDELLRNLWTQNLSPQEIAGQLGRSVAAIMTRAARLGLPRRFAPGRKAGRHYENQQTTRTALPRSAGQAAVAGDDELPRTRVSERICLMCLKKFISEGAHNRICNSCKGSSDYIAGSRIPDTTYGTGD